MKNIKKTLLFFICLFGVALSILFNCIGKAEVLAAEDLTPDKPYKIVNVVSGVHVYWDEVDGVEKYGLWRSETGKNGTYKWLANPTTFHFTDTKVETGKTYFYKVTSMDPDTGNHSDKSEPIGIIYVSTPDITQRFNKAAGITVTWDKITGATGYAIYRKSFDGADEWVRVATISGNSTFTWQDTSVKNANGTIYRYTVRALAGSNMKTLSGCRSTGRTMVRLTSRTLNSATAVNDTSIKCTWGTTVQATGYEVRFMVGSEVYKTVTIGNYKAGVKTFTGLEQDTTYKIQVRSYKKVEGVGSFYSAWSTALEATTDAAPTPIEVAVPEDLTVVNASKGVLLTWSEVDEVIKYGVWRSETGENGSYQWLGNPTTTSYLDKKAESGKTYYYKVTSMNPETGKHGNKSEAVGTLYVGEPELTSITNTEEGIKLAWNVVDGANGYVISRKSFDSNDDFSEMVIIEDKNTASWTDTSVCDENGRAYAYMIQALAGENLEAMSSYNTTGYSMVRLISTSLIVLPRVMHDGYADCILCEWECNSKKGEIDGYEILFLKDSKEVEKYDIPKWNTVGKGFDVDLVEKCDGKASFQIRTYKNLPEQGTFYSEWSEGAEAVKPSDMRARINQLVNEITASAKTDFEKALAIYEWLIFNVEGKYGIGDQYLENALINGYAACGGYADSFETLAKLAGLEAITVTATGPSDRHGWNQVKIEGKWYNVDVTWGDMDIDKNTPYEEAIWMYTQFLISDETLNIDHSRYVIDANTPANACNEDYDVYDYVILRDRGDCGVAGKTLEDLECSILQKIGEGYKIIEVFDMNWEHDYVDTECMLEDITENIDGFAIKFDENMAGIYKIAILSREEVSDGMKLTIPEGVTCIDDYTFSDNTDLVHIELPKSITFIGNDAFCGCSNLVTINIPEGVTEIRGSAFEDCINLTSIELPDSVIEIYSRAFYNCDNLANVKLSKNLTTIGMWAFRGCSALQSIKVPTSVTKIGDNAFSADSTIYCTKYSYADSWARRNGYKVINE